MNYENRPLFFTSWKLKKKENLSELFQITYLSNLDTIIDLIADVNDIYGVLKGRTKRYRLIQIFNRNLFSVKTLFLKGLD